MRKHKGQIPWIIHQHGSDVHQKIVELHKIESGCKKIANPADVFGANRDEEYPMPTVKYAAGSCMLWAYLFAGGPGHLVQIHGIMDSIK